MNKLIQDLFLYFARFPLLDSVKKTFNLGESTLDGYTQLKALVDAMDPAENQLVPEITDYIFGVSQKRVEKRISKVSGFYLFIDYGEIRNNPDQFNITKSEFYIVATVARPVQDNEVDDASEILISQMALDYLLRIRAYMKADDRNHLVKSLRLPDDVTPFVAPELNNSVGFSMMFTRSGVLL